MGSLHCAGMCGPLVLMTPVIGPSRPQFILSKLTYHAGRLTTYATIGAIFGLIGESLVFAGLQCWISLIVGTLMLLALFMAIPLKSRFTRVPLFIKSLFGQFLRKRTLASIFSLGATNGLLPCGLVYMAATASIATGNLIASVGYMLLFGLGTLPMLLAISCAGQGLALFKRQALQKLVPVSVAIIGLMLIIRSQPISLITQPSVQTKCAACAHP